MIRSSAPWISGPASARLIALWAEAVDRRRVERLAEPVAVGEPGHHDRHEPRARVELLHRRRDRVGERRGAGRAVAGRVSRRTRSRCPRRLPRRGLTRSRTSSSPSRAAPGSRRAPRRATGITFSFSEASRLRRRQRHAQHRLGDEGAEQGSSSPRRSRAAAEAVRVHGLAEHGGEELEALRRRLGLGLRGSAATAGPSFSSALSPERRDGGVARAAVGPQVEAEDALLADAERVEALCRRARSSSRRPR